MFHPFINSKEIEPSSLKGTPVFLVSLTTVLDLNPYFIFICFPLTFSLD